MGLDVSTGQGTERRQVQFVSHDFFETLGVAVRHGRGFTPRDDTRGASLVALLSDRSWRLAFGSDPGVAGRVITIAGREVAVVGVLQRGFRGVSLADAPRGIDGDDSHAGAALGARRRELIQLVMGETVRLVGIGVAAGLALAWGGAGVIRSFLYRIEPLDPLTLATVALLLLLLACIVSLRPALRAARVDLAAVLKAE